MLTTGGGCPLGARHLPVCRGHRLPAPQTKLPSGNTPYAGVAFPAALSCGPPGGRSPHENCLVTPVACVYVCVKPLAGSASEWKGGYEKCLLCVVQMIREGMKLLGIQLTS